MSEEPLYEPELGFCESFDRGTAGFTVNDGHFREDISFAESGDELFFLIGAF